MTKSRAVAELSFAAILWGFGFVAAIWALESFSPAETLLFRFLAAFFVGELVFFGICLKNGSPFLSRDFKQQLSLAFPAGAFLGGMLLLQTVGLKYTTATKSGFITCLYVILVPLFNFLLFKHRLGLRSLLFVSLALLGTYFLVGGPIENINLGDLWTLACAIIAAFHIIYIGRMTSKITNSFRFNNLQSFWCLLLAMPFVYFQSNHFENPLTRNAVIGILCLGIGSSVIAFFLQIRAQKSLDDTTASMLFLLESPFAALFGFMVLSERLSLNQAIGAGLIMTSALLQVIFTNEKNKGH